mgnify:CR=1 FL=1
MGEEYTLFAARHYGINARKFKSILFTRIKIGIVKNRNPMSYK